MKWVKVEKEMKEALAIILYSYRDLDERKIKTELQLAQSLR